MPSMSGLQFTRELRKTRPDIPILMTSGYIDPQDQISAIRLGVTPVLIKPLSRKNSSLFFTTSFKSAGS